MNFKERLEASQKKIDEIKGQINETSEAAKNAGQMKKDEIQANINAAKAKITEKKEAHDKAEQEQRIINLLDYADRCQELALALALESEASILEAASDAADYMEKYGESK